MEEIKVLVARSQAGNLGAYGELVGRFQDMAYGYAYSLLGDFHLAEDAAQEAFIEAYRKLSQVRDPQAFPGWFRKVIWTQCQRILRRKELPVQHLEGETASLTDDPGEALVKAEMKDSVLAAIQSLPENERTTTTLFYINGYSQEEIAGFLEVPVTTVKNRLHTSRKRLRERMVGMVANEMKRHPLPEKFPERIRLLLELPRPLDVEGHPVKEMWELFKSCFPDFKFVELDEVLAKETYLCQQDAEVKCAYTIDEKRLLRTSLTSQLVRHWQQQGGGPCRWITVGRVFRSHQDVGPTNLQVHHQAEILWSGRGLDERQSIETALKVASVILPNIECRQQGTFAYAPVPKALEYQAKWRNRWLEIAVGGVVEAAWLNKMKLDPQRDGAISICFGLERCAQARYDLDDVRKLWQPPYVPKQSQ